jgi:hypothetical protein
MNRAVPTLARLGLGLCVTTGVARTAAVAYTLDPGTRSAVQLEAVPVSSNNRFQGTRPLRGHAPEPRRSAAAK